MLNQRKEILKKQEKLRKLRTLKESQVVPESRFHFNTTEENGVLAVTPR